MHTFARSSMTSGVALIGASAIALSPIVVAPQQVHLPAIPVSSIATTLTASANPISEWAQVLTASFNNLSAIGQQVWADPAPILKQIIANQIGYANTTGAGLGAAGNGFVTAVKALPEQFRQAAQQLAAGHIKNGLDLAFYAMLNLVVNPGMALLGSGILDIPGKVMQNITNVVKLLPAVIVSVGFSVLGTVGGVQSAFEDTAQAVYDAVHAGNFGAAVNEILNAPAVLTNAFLNGYAPTFSPGILTPSGGFGMPGLVATLVINVRDAIAQALGAPVPAAAKVADVGPSALPSAAASVATITLGTEKVATPEATHAAATETTPTAEPAATTPATTEPAATTPAATEPATTTPATTEPAATAPETPSTATETKPETTPETKPDTKPETKPEAGTTSGSSTTPNGGTDTAGGNKVEPGTAGTPTKPETKPEAGTTSGSSTTPNGGTDTAGGNKAEPGKTATPTKPSGSSSTGTGSSAGSAGSGSTGSVSAGSGSESGASAAA